MTLSVLEAKLLAADVSKQTHDSITTQIDASARNAVPAQLNNDQKAQRRPADTARPPDASMIAGLLLGSPEFQRR